MVKIVNIFKAAGLWVGTIFLLYGTKEVPKGFAGSYGRRETALAVSRSAEQGGVKYGGTRVTSRLYSQMSPSTGGKGMSPGGLHSAMALSTGGAGMGTTSFSTGQRLN